MTDVEPTKTTDWLAVLRPTDLRPPRYIKAPEHFPHILKAFGPLSPLDFRRAVLAIDEIVVGYKSARTRNPPMKFDEADKLLAQIENSFSKSLTSWERAKPLYQAMLNALIITTSPEIRRYTEFDWEKIDPTTALQYALLAVRTLRSRNVYREATGHPSQKRPQRELLWEPLFGLLSRSGFRAVDFAKHQPLMRTVKALHFAIGIDPPDTHLFKQAIRDWRKKEAEGKG